MTDYRSHSYASADKRLTLLARDYSGEGPVLLMMHGLTRNSADFEALAEQLAGRYRLIVPDQRGRGLSERDPEPTNYRPDIYVSDMWALLDSLDVHQAGLIGTSLGGLMAMLMAATIPDRVIAIVLNDIGTEVMEQGIERIKSYAGQNNQMADWSEATKRCKEINSAALPDLTDDEWLAFARRACVERPDRSVAFAYDPAISRGLEGEKPHAVPADLWPVWAMIDAMPTLVVRGEVSDVLSADTVAEMDNRHGGPFLSVNVPNRGHAPLLNEPAALNAVEAFLDKYVS